MSRFDREEIARIFGVPPDMVTSTKLPMRELEESDRAAFFAHLKAWIADLPKERVRSVKVGTCSATVIGKRFAEDAPSLAALLGEFPKTVLGLPLVIDPAMGPDEWAIVDSKGDVIQMGRAK